MKQGKLTRNAKAFKAANAMQGVVEQGGNHHAHTYTYRLKDGRKFTLLASERRAVGVIHWHGMASETVK